MHLSSLKINVLCHYMKTKISQKRDTQVHVVMSELERNQKEIKPPWSELIMKIIYIPLYCLIFHEKTGQKIKQKCAHNRNYSKPTHLKTPFCNNSGFEASAIFSCFSSFPIYSEIYHTITGWQKNMKYEKIWNEYLTEQ